MVNLQAQAAKLEAKTSPTGPICSETSLLNHGVILLQKHTFFLRDHATKSMEFCRLGLKIPTVTSADQAPIIS
jgi:hypothetical protein